MQSWETSVPCERGNWKPDPYLMGSSTVIRSSCHGLGCFLLKDNDVQTECCKAVGPGATWGHFPVLLEPRLLERPGPVLGVVEEDTRDTHSHPPPTPATGSDIRNFGVTPKL